MTGKPIPPPRAPAAVVRLRPVGPVRVDSPGVRAARARAVPVPAVPPVAVARVAGGSFGGRPGGGSSGGYGGTARRWSGRRSGRSRWSRWRARGPWRTRRRSRPSQPAATPSPSSQPRRARADPAHRLHTVDRPGPRHRGHHRARLDRSRPRSEAQPVGRRRHPVPAPAGGDGDGHPVADRRHDRPVRRRARRRRPAGRPGRGARGRTAGQVLRRRRRGRGRGRSAAPPTGGHRHGPRRPRQDPAARPDPLGQRGGR